MSASLVGSEMCIRDRPYGAVGRQAFCAATTPRQMLRELTAWVLRLGTVSYTHLTLPTICSV
eukprot:11745391-Alexandrium_andersonii.AAC.1